MMVPRDMQETLAIDGYANAVVGIAHIPGIRRRPGLPVGRSDRAPGKHDLAALFVEGCVLSALMRRDGIPAEDGDVDGVAGPAHTDGIEARAASADRLGLCRTDSWKHRQGDGKPTENEERYPHAAIVLSRQHHHVISDNTRY